MLHRGDLAMLISMYVCFWRDVAMAWPDSADQAAIRGGCCGPNIRDALRHLGSGRQVPSCQAPQGDLWDLVLGEAAPHVLRILNHLHASALDPCPALVLADQSKAFERVSHAWQWHVLHGWGFPP